MPGRTRRRCLPRGLPFWRPTVRGELMGQRLTSVALWILVAAQVGCAPAAGPVQTSPSGPGTAAVDEGANKTLVLAQLNALVLGAWGGASTVGGGFALIGVHSTGLSTLAGHGHR